MSNDTSKFRTNVVTKEYTVVIDHHGMKQIISVYAESEEAAKLKIPEDAEFIEFLP